MSFYFRNSLWLAIFFAVTFLWKLDVVSSIFCYHCNSLYDPRCGEQFDPYTLGTVNCSLRDPPEGLEDIEPTLCRTIKMEVFGKIRIVRSCGYIRDDSFDDGLCQRTSGTHELFTTYCSCSTDLCNPAVTRAEPAALLVAAAFFLTR